MSLKNAIYIKDGHKSNGEVVDFAAAILDGVKKGETRDHKRLPRGRWMGVAKDGQVFGRVMLGEPYMITKDMPEYRDAMIAGTEYDIKPRQPKYYYPVRRVEDFRNDPKPIVRHGVYAQYEED